MNWFEGSIANAVKASKTQNAIFIVFVEGPDENSTSIRDMLDGASSKLNSSNFVAVKLEAGSESYNQFVQIYQLVPVPSLFFIGKTGTPIEVIPQAMSKDEFLTKIDTIISKSGYVFFNQVSAKAETSESLIKNESEPSTSKSSPTTPPTPLEPTVIVNTVTTTPAEQLSTEEKTERAKQIIEENRESKRLEEEENERKKEIERRKMGQDIQKMRRQQQDQELKQIREDILREKNEEAAAKQKILLQIQQDKEERAKKFLPEPAAPTVSSTPPPVVTQRVVRDTNTARLQFRLADGSSHTHDFPAVTTLQEVRDYIRATMNLPYRNFDLSTTFPRRQFTTVDNSRNLVDLELIPNSVLLVVPVTSTAVTQASPVGGILSGLILFFLSPVYSVIGYVREYYNNWRNPRPQPYKRPTDTPGTSKSSSNGPTQPKRRLPDSTVIQRQGNIHRLTDRKDDNSDDENNTWNGNSTQQM